MLRWFLLKKGKERSMRDVSVIDRTLRLVSVLTPSFGRSPDPLTYWSPSLNSPLHARDISDSRPSSRNPTSWSLYFEALSYTCIWQTRHMLDMPSRSFRSSKYSLNWPVFESCFVNNSCIYGGQNAIIMFVNTEPSSENSASMHIGSQFIRGRHSFAFYIQYVIHSHFINYRFITSNTCVPLC